MIRKLLYCAAFLFFVSSPLLALGQNTFPTTGNVGIGTTSPTRTLDVRGIIQSNSHVIVTNPANASASLQLNWLNNVPRIRLGGSGAGAEEGFDFQGINDKSLFRIAYNGNIGIGTANPITSSSYRVLDITGASPSTGGYIRLATSDASGEARILTSDNALIFDVQKPSMAFLWRNDNGQELVRLNPDGLTRWSGNAASFTEIGSNGSGQFIRQSGNDGTQSWHIRGYEVDGVQAEFKSGGITVNGTVKSKEVVVVTDVWADYVFDDDYPLRPLSQVRSFIDAHGHLPNIPSEQEVLKEGIHLGEMNIRLLEKIEELTLYLLNQEKRINQQQLLIDRQQQALQAIEAALNERTGN